MNTLSAITELASKQFGRDAEEIDVDKPFEKLGIDSLGILEFYSSSRITWHFHSDEAVKGRRFARRSPVDG